MLIAVFLSLFGLGVALVVFTLGRNPERIIAAMEANNELIREMWRLVDRITRARTLRTGDQRRPKVRAPVCRPSFFLALLLPMKVAKDAQANLEETTPQWVEQFGERNARFIRAVQIGLIIGGHWLRPMANLLSAVKRLVGL